MTYYDYFRAPNNETVVQRMSATNGWLITASGERVVDVVETKVGQVAFGKLVATALDIPWEMDIADGRLA